MRVELWVIRHGAANEPGTVPADAERQLTPKGRRQAQRLQRVVPTLDRLFASPRLRAAQTAEALAKHAQDGVETLQALVEAEAAELPEALGTVIAKGDLPDGRLPRIAIVGHEPQLSEVIGLLITGEAGDVPASVRMRKGAVARLVGSLRPGGMQLELMLAQGDLRRL